MRTMTAYSEGRPFIMRFRQLRAVIALPSPEENPFRPFSHLCPCAVVIDSVEGDSALQSPFCLPSIDYLIGMPCMGSFSLPSTG